MTGENFGQILFLKRMRQSTTRLWRDVLADPRGALGRLCAAVGIPFSDAMLAWPAGPRDTDGVWAPAWYDTVERSTGFDVARAEEDPAPLDADLQRLAEAARPFYERLAAHALR